MEKITSDVFTQCIFLRLSETERYALLTAFPNLSNKVKWNLLYLQRNTEHDPELLKIYDKHFSEEYSKESRLKAMKEYYDSLETDCMDCLNDECEDEEHWEDDYENRNIPIVTDEYYKLQDYINDIDDYIYPEIKLLKLSRL